MKGLWRTGAVAATIVAVAIGVSSCASVSKESTDGGNLGGPPERHEPVAPKDASWPPAPVGDPNPVTIEIPVNWPEADKAVAREWVTVQQSTRACQLARGIDYRYIPVWEQSLDEAGNVVDGPPPADWSTHFQRPFQWFRNSAMVCFDRALVSVGRESPGPLDFSPRLPRFEESDFADPTTLDMPDDWSDEEQAAGRESWAVETHIRACMAEAGYPSYGVAPYWLLTDERRAEDPWVNSLPLADQPAGSLALNGENGGAVYDWQTAGCVGRANHEVHG